MKKKATVQKIIKKKLTCHKIVRKKVIKEKIQPTTKDALLNPSVIPLSIFIFMAEHKCTHHNTHYHHIFFVWQLPFQNMELICLLVF